MYSVIKGLRSEQRGAALIIVLAFVVLFAGLSVAYLSRTTSDRQIAHSSFHQSNVDQLVQSAVDNIIGDLRQEITNGSTAVTQADGTTLYTPTATANMVPQRSGNAAGAPNLIRRSVRVDPIPAPGRSSRASAVNSQDDVSSNGRSISSTRWNGHYLVPKGNTADDSSPIPAFTNATPDWVFVTDAGGTVITSPSTSVIGRYSYAVYAEGGLLDMNVAGYPTDAVASTATIRPGRKGSAAYADLSALGSTDSNRFGNPDAAGVYQGDRLVGWRNYATTQPNNNFPDTGSQAFAKNFQTDTTATRPATAFYDYVLNNTNGFLSRTATPAPNGRTDQAFIQRQQLIAFRKAIGSTTSVSSNLLQYLGTFSREINAPSFSPSTPAGSTIDYATLANTDPAAINPNFLLRRATSSFTRFDGTTANIGEPLVKTRFPLSRLAWVTYKGPSAVVYAANNIDPVITALRSAGVSLSTIKAGTAANVKACFGVTFQTGGGGGPGSPWTYTNPTGTSAASRILRLDEVAAAAREPDFFELLQAGILSGSLGQNTGGGVTGGNVFPDVHMSNSAQHILSIGAAIMDQADPDSIPMRIQLNPSGTLWTAYGVENLPYITQMYPIAGTSPNTPAQWATYLLFQLWNPHQNASTLPNNVRLRVDGAIGIYKGGNGESWVNGTTPQIIANGSSLGQSVTLQLTSSFAAPAPLTNTNTTGAAAAPGVAGQFAVLAAPTLP